jgi:hypothetical protein
MLYIPVLWWDLTCSKLQNLLYLSFSWKQHGVFKALSVSCRSCETIDGEAKVAKQKIVAIDDTKKSITFKVIEGDLLKEYKNFEIVVQATPKGEGSLVHLTMEYEKLKDDIPEPNTLLQFGIDLSKDIDAHLTA